MSKQETVSVENVNHPGLLTNVNAVKYHAMRRALLEVLPDSPPGLTQREMLGAVVSHLPEEIFPEGKTSGWWAKTVQLDLEAKGIVERTDSKPLTWYQVRGNE